MRHDDQTDQQRHHRTPGARSPKALALTYAPPVFGWLLLYPATLGAWMAWGHGYLARPLFAMCAMAATLGLVLFVAQQTRTRGPSVRWLACGTTAAAGSWVILAVLAGPLTRPIPDLYLGGGAVTCVFWATRRALMSAKGDQQLVDGRAAKLLEVLDGAKLSRVRTEPTRLGPPVVTARAEVERGRQTVEDLRGKAEQIEAVAGLRPGSVSIRADQGDAGMSDMLITPVDTLQRPILFAGPDRPGTSIAEPIRFGAYEDGTDTEIIIPGDEKTHRNLAHLLIQGMTGAGKSEGIRTLMTNVLCRTEVTVIGADPVKGLQTLGIFVEVGALELVSLELAGAKMLLAAVRRAIRDRGSFLGARGFKQWEPGCGLTLLVVWLEEANWATQSAVLEQLAAEARSVGIWLVCSQQRASHTKTSTDLRANMPAGWCFGVHDAIDATFNLPDDVIDAGARPERWQNTRPGYSYLVHPSIPEPNWTKVMRPELAIDDQIRDALTTWAHVRTPMDEVTRGAFGDTYDIIRKAMADGGILLDKPAKPGKSADRGRLPVPIGEEVDLMDDDDWGDELDTLDEEGEDDPQSDDDGVPPLGPELEPGIHVDPDAPIGPPPAHLRDLPFGVPAPSGKLSTEQARQVVQHHLRDLLAAGKGQVTPAEIAAMKPPTTRSREWVRQELDRLCQQPDVGEVGLQRDDDAAQPGVFLILAPQLALSGTGT